MRKDMRSERISLLMSYRLPHSRTMLFSCNCANSSERGWEGLPRNSSTSRAYMSHGVHQLSIRRLRKGHYENAPCAVLVATTRHYHFKPDQAAYHRVGSKLAITRDLHQPWSHRALWDRSLRASMVTDLSPRWG